MTTTMTTGNGGHQRGHRGGRSGRSCAVPLRKLEAATTSSATLPSLASSLCGATRLRSVVGGGSQGGGGNLAVTGESPAWTSGTTSVMLRNIPNRYTTEEIIEELMDWGFEGAFDFFYLPIDFKTKRNKGYAFMNFRSPILASRFHETFDQRKLQRYVTQKVLETQPATTQGLEANIKAYRAQAQRVQNPWFKPIIFVQTDNPNKPWCGVSLCGAKLPLVRPDAAAAPASAALAESSPFRPPPGLEHIVPEKQTTLAFPLPTEESSDDLKAPAPSQLELIDTASESTECFSDVCDGSMSGPQDGDENVQDEIDLPGTDAADQAIWMPSAVMEFLLPCRSGCVG